MGKLTMHNYDRKTKKWMDITPDSLEINTYQQATDILLEKYCKELISSEMNPMEKYMILKSELKKSGTWFDRLINEVCSNYYFLYDDLAKLKEAFELFNSGKDIQYANEMIKYINWLITYEDKDLILSFGHSVGGFWGTDGSFVIDSITTKLSDSVCDKIMNNTNLSPFIFGNEL